ncbi:MAG TPA: tetratricopeptide repeat protein [Opitutaceae bacterium]|nr:tetratricopeptide repeat protein [Opitutaceae bacterium]
MPAAPLPAWAGPAAIGLAALAAYAGSLGGAFVYDDARSILENPTLRHWTAAFLPPGGGLTVSGRPLLNASLALNFALSGTAAWSYHAVNLLIHAAAGLALFGLLRRTLGRAGPACAIALLWTVHPLASEPVLYTVQRAESLMGLWYLLTLYCFVRGWPVRSVLCCLLGMASKEVMVTAPLMVLLYDRTFLAGSFAEAWRRRRGYYLALAATWALLAFLVAGAGNRGGTAGLGVGVSPWEYGLTQFQALARYLRLALWPHPLAIDYGTFWVRSAGQVLPSAAWVAPLALATVWAVARPGAAGSARRALGFAGAWFFGILAPTSLTPGTIQMIVEHRAYLPLAAPVAVLVLAGERLGRAALGGSARWALPAAAGLLAIAGAAATARRARDYASPLALWTQTVAARPGDSIAQNNLGRALFAAGRKAEAEARYRRALQLDPDNPEARYNLANLMAADGRLDGAIDQYRQVLRLRPAMFEAHNNLGLALVKAGRVPEALAEFGETLRLEPDSFEGHLNRADALAQEDRLPESVAEYRRALALDPGSAAAHENLGLSLARLNQVDAALGEFAAAVRLDPGEADYHRDLGIALGHVGRNAEAEAELAEAARLGWRP